eukprot:XP_014624343.2 receptor-like protein EIX1 [Glycine max]
MNSSSIYILVFVQLWLLSLPCRESVCIPSERETLLKFKNNLIDPSNRLWSWNHNNTNCCHWYGVLCHNLTSHLLQLHLSSSDYAFYDEEAYRRWSFGGEISPCLADLKHLNYLDLSGNDFEGMSIPSFLGTMTSLTHLNLSDSGFHGKIPPQIGNLSNLVYLDLSSVVDDGTVPSQIGNLSKLRYLDLSDNYFEGMAIPSFLCAMTSLTHLDLSSGFMGKIPSQIGNLSNLVYLGLGGSYDLLAENVEWVSSMWKLEYLHLSKANLSKAFHWLHTLQSLPSLTHLYLSDCTLPHYNEPSLLNFSSLQTLHLYRTSYSPAISFVPKWIFKLKKLVSLQLQSNEIQGSIPGGIRNLTLLQNLDLSGNSFSSSIPDCLYGLHRLMYLDLSYNNLLGTISDALGNLTSLVELDLSRNQLEGTIPTSLGNLTSLVELYLSNNQLEGTIPPSLGNLTSLIRLDLSYSQLEGNIPTSLGNLTSLVELDLSYSQLEGNIPTSLGNVCNLRVIRLSYLKLNQQVNELLEILAPCISHGLTRLAVQSSQLSGNLTDHIGAFENIVLLDFSNNSIGGALPRSFGKLSSLRFLNLSINKFSGNPFESLGSLSKLSSLYIDGNLFHGVVKEDDLANLTSLTEFGASGNNFTLKVGPNWRPNFRLSYLDVTSWQLSPNFPSWIQSQNKLQYVGLSNTGILDSIPTWFWETPSQILYLNLSYNHIHGEIETTLKNPISIQTIDLSSNHLCGKLPYLSSDVFQLDLSSNSFSESMNDFLCKHQDGPVQLEFLNLASNNLSGEIPDCWMNWTSLVYVNLQSNHFVGNLPQSMGSLADLQSLQIRNNTLSGIFPTSLKKNNQLISLDLGENNLSGSIPTWVGEKLLNVKILLLRSNSFTGHIPNEICQMSLLQVLDLAQNNLSGNIPSCFSNLSAMTLKNQSTDPHIYSQAQLVMLYTSWYSIVSVLLWLKGRGDEYRNILGLVTSIDLSSNKLLGEIPKKITNLNGLNFLNLSHNQLIGHIPQGIGNMGSLQSIDFSRNQLSGEIPPTISNLSFLSMLDVSYNHLKGKIPTGTQLQTFDASSFIGNNLCGPPLPINCWSNGKTHSYEGSDGHGVNWFFVGATIGFVVGFWIVIAPLLICRSWRLGISTICSIFALEGNEIQGPIPGGIRNLTLLQNLDLSGNSFSSFIPNCLCGLHRLKFLNLMDNNLHGTISDALRNLTSLVELYLSYNQLEGTIPTFLGNLRNSREIDLTFLDLSINKFSGNPFESLGSLSKLSVLHIDGNNFQGVVNEDDLANLTSLKEFIASGNNFTLKVGPNWIPNFQLTYLDVTSWQIGPNFPSWIQSQNKLQYIGLSNTGILDSIPTWFWEPHSQVLHLNLSHNHIHGELVTTLQNPISIQTVDLSTNHLCGKLPYLSNDVYELDLSTNSFSESMQEFLCNNQDKAMQLEFLNLASNNLSGEIP